MRSASKGLTVAPEAFGAGLPEEGMTARQPRGVTCCFANLFASERIGLGSALGQKRSLAEVRCAPIAAPRHSAIAVAERLLGLRQVVFHAFIVLTHVKAVHHRMMSLNA